MFDIKSIKDPSFVKSLSKKELQELCNDIRSFLVDNISRTGGHLSSNLGVVELVVALYYVFDLDENELLFDVGHQSYVHKILSGRASEFDTLRQFGGISGYINRSESKYDIWESGHSSTSISAATGLMLSGDKRQIVIIGDSSIMNGVAMEGLNFLGTMKCGNPIIILNDNEMGISKSVGALTKSFKRLRGTKLKRGNKALVIKVFPNSICSVIHKTKNIFKLLFKRYNIFESMGFDYYGPYNGNNINTMIKVLKRIKRSNHPVILHANTTKGKGYYPSELDKIGDFHGVSPFDVKTGKSINNSKKISYSQLVAQYLCEKRKNHSFKVITPATMVGSKLEEFMHKYPSDIFDVGIAEEHATIMAAGMALNKQDVVLLMYSTFAQRAYDQILNDVARQNLKVIFGIDRAGIVGEDGVTHQGLYDVSMLMGMPNIVVTMPKDELEAIGLFNYAFNQNNPIVVRYPRGSEEISTNIDYTYTCDLSWTILNEGNSAAVIGYGADIERINKIVKENNLDVLVINARCIKPIDLNMLKSIFDKNIPVIVFEQVIASGTLYHQILEYKEKNDYKAKVYSKGFTADTLIPHGSISDIYKKYGLDDEALKNTITEVIE